MNKIFKIGIIVIILLFAFSTLPFASEIKDKKVKYEDIIRKGKKVNPDLKTFKATLYIKSNVAGMPIPFFAKLFYKKPDKLKLMIPMVPSVLKSKKGFFQDAVPRSFSSKDYEGKILKEINLNKNVDCYLVKLIPRKKSKIKKVYLWVEKNSCLAPKTKIFYEDGSDIVSMQTFRREGKYILPDKQRIDFNFSKFKAVAFIKYKKYKINVPMDDVLKKEKK